MRTSIRLYVFLGSFLLFSLEPLVGRLMLPLFGGGFHVWTAALMFFQGALLLAYAYAHLGAHHLGRWHLLLLAVPLVCLPVSLGEAQHGADVQDVLILLAARVLVPFVALATTAVVAQRWLAQRGQQPYSLYGWSNAGSLLALLTYPLMIEPFMGLRSQRWTWSVLYVVYVVIAVWSYVSLPPLGAQKNLGEKPSPAAPKPGRIVYWVLLGAAPSAFLMAVTNLIVLDVGNVPLVWIVPLALYLLSFVVAFADPADGEMSRVPLAVQRLWPHVAAVGIFLFSGAQLGGGVFSAVIHLIVLTFVSLAAHGELYRSRPNPVHLTLFYLTMALGGWLGGAAVALAAPYWLSDLYEYPIALVLLLITMGWGQRRAIVRWFRSASKIAIVASLSVFALIAYKWFEAGAMGPHGAEVVEVRRSFYGVYRVLDNVRADGRVRDLVSGGTRHGRQRVGDLQPLSYYHPEGPLGETIEMLQPRRIGVVGLGAGAAAAYIHAPRELRFFEIDPAVVDLAQRHFTYLQGRGDSVDIVVADARLALSRESAETFPRYDLLLIDAFAGDAIPTHLLTREALELYASRIEERGVLLLHISNRYYDLRPVLSAAAHALHLRGVYTERVQDLSRDEDPSRYLALARSASILEGLRAQGWVEVDGAASRSTMWTDDYTHPLSALDLN